MPQHAILSVPPHARSTTGDVALLGDRLFWLWRADHESLVCDLESSTWTPMTSREARRAHRGRLPSPIGARVRHLGRAGLRAEVGDPVSTEPRGNVARMPCACLVFVSIVLAMPPLAIALGRARRTAHRAGAPHGPLLHEVFLLGALNVSFCATWGALGVASIVRPAYLFGALFLVNLGALPSIRRIVDAPPAKARPPIRPRIERTFE